jgi:hypothetical protein
VLLVCYVCGKSVLNHELLLLWPLLLLLLLHYCSCSYTAAPALIQLLLPLSHCCSCSHTAAPALTLLLQLVHCCSCSCTAATAVAVVAAAALTLLLLLLHCCCSYTAPALTLLLVLLPCSSLIRCGCRPVTSEMISVRDFDTVSEVIAALSMTCSFQLPWKEYKGLFPIAPCQVI